MSGQIAVGLKKGHKVDKRETLLKPGARKGRCGKRVKLIRDLVRDVAGTAPYEKRMMELLKTGRDKRALKLSKRKVSEILSNISVGLSTRKVNLCVLMRC
jgi:large subunit ribosomal protein L36e